MAATSRPRWPASGEAPTTVEGIVAKQGLGMYGVDGTSLKIKNGAYFTSRDRHEFFQRLALTEAPDDGRLESHLTRSIHSSVVVAPSTHLRYFFRSTRSTSQKTSKTSKLFGS